MSAPTSIQWLNGAPTIKSSSTRPKQPTLVFFARIVSLINQKRGLFQTPFVSFSPRNRKAAFTFAMQRNDCPKEFTLPQNAPKHKPFPTAAADTGTRTKAAILVFFGGACYGFNATCYKLSYAWGFSSAQIAAAQMWAASHCLPYSFFLIAPEENDGQNLAAPTP